MCSPQSLIITHLSYHCNRIPMFPIIMIQWKCSLPAYRDRTVYRTVIIANYIEFNNRHSIEVTRSLVYEIVLTEKGTPPHSLTDANSTNEWMNGTGKMKQWNDEHRTESETTKWWNNESTTETERLVQQINTWPRLFIDYSTIHIFKSSEKLSHSDLLGRYFCC